MSSGKHPPFIRRLRDSQAGVAGLEFALWVTAFFFVVMGAIDFGAFYIQRGKMNEAVSAAAVASFSSADNVEFGSLPGYVRGLANDASMNVTTACNGSVGSCTNTSRSCSCLKSDGTYVSRTCGSVCTGSGVTPGSTAGYYLTISASQNFSPILIPQGVLAGKTMSQHATVRLQ